MANKPKTEPIPNPENASDIRIKFTDNGKDRTCLHWNITILKIIDEQKHIRNDERRKTVGKYSNKYKQHCEKGGLHLEI